MLESYWLVERSSAKKLGVNGALREGIDLSASRLLVSAALKLNEFVGAFFLYKFSLKSSENVERLEQRIVFLL